MISATRCAGASSTSWYVARRVDSCLCAADWAIGVLLGSGYRAAPAAQQPREHVSADVAAGPGARSQARDVCPAHQASSQERRSDLELVGVVLDGLNAWCADRPSLTALSRVLGDDASAAPASSPASRDALEQLQRKPHRTGIGGGSRGWFRIGHGRERYHEPINHDTVTVRCSHSQILSQGPDLLDERGASSRELLACCAPPERIAEGRPTWMLRPVDQE